MTGPITTTTNTTEAAAPVVTPNDAAAAAAQQSAAQAPAVQSGTAVIPPAAATDNTEKTFPERYVHELREEAKASRLALEKAIADGQAAAAEAAKKAAADATSELTQNLGRALGLVTENAAPTPEELLTQAKAAQADAERQRAEAETAATTAAATARAAQVEAELYRRATVAGADPLALIDSRAFMQRPDVQALDPGSAEFQAAVDTAIRSAVDADPRYRAARVAVPRSGADLSAGNAHPGAGATNTSVQSFMDEKFKVLSGGKGGKVHSRFLNGNERGLSADPVIPGQG